MTAVRTYEVLCSWIETAITNDHLTCVKNYINNVYIEMYPIHANPLHKEMIDSMSEKIEAKWVDYDDNNSITPHQPNID